MGKAAALILLKLLINGHKRCNTIDAPPFLSHEQNSIFSCKQNTIHDLRGPEKYNYKIHKN